ncbi:hypothetical protein CQW23_15225 [Capsicum baccatum]|uniref:DUF4216 domain-containing protein n=1 Tax=Capsicum baccatum TaxID=33114 RepID=A0A2G2WLF3_CAPBA|nr:hypothetical protein CQW23_15225 [Capsicum baccatum]
MKDLAEGPLHMVQSFNGYVVNGYKFHTEKYGSNKSTMNNGVCIRGSSYSTDNIDYYGRLIEILRLEYNALTFKQTVLCKCSWFDLTPKHSTRVHPQYNLVDVNKRRVFNKYESFMMSVQASQDEDEDEDEDEDDEDEDNNDDHDDDDDDDDDEEEEEEEEEGRGRGQK